MKRANRPVFGGSSTTTLTVLTFVQLLGALALLMRFDCKAGQSESRANGTNSLRDARRDFATQLVRKQKIDEPVPDPPPRFFRVVKYDSPVGKLAAYLSPSPQEGEVATNIKFTDDELTGALH